MIVHSS